MYPKPGSPLTYIRPHLPDHVELAPYRLNSDRFPKTGSGYAIDVVDWLTTMKAMRFRPHSCAAGEIYKTPEFESNTGVTHAHLAGFTQLRYPTIGGPTERNVCISHAATFFLDAPAPVSPACCLYSSA